MPKFITAAAFAIPLSLPAVAQNVAPNTGNPQAEVSQKEQGKDVKEQSTAASQRDAKSEAQIPKPSTSSSTGGNTVGPHTTP